MVWILFLQDIDSHRFKIIKCWWLALTANGIGLLDEDQCTGKTTNLRSARTVQKLHLSVIGLIRSEEIDPMTKSVCSRPVSHHFIQVIFVAVKYNVGINTLTVDSTRQDLIIQHLQIYIIKFCNFQSRSKQNEWK